MHHTLSIENPVTLFGLFCVNQKADFASWFATKYSVLLGVGNCQNFKPGFL